jgi:hypothetical protein
MRLYCISGQHDVAPDEVCNQGFGFSHCRTCGRDMIRSHRDWRPVPSGFRVVWRRGIPRQTEIIAAQLIFDLPVSGRALVVPHERRRGHVSDMLGLLLIAVQYLTEAAAVRLRSWLKALFLPRAARARPIRLESRTPTEAPASAP